MQASKIMPGTVYAIEFSGEMVRFRVEKVITTRFRNTGSPHDYNSIVVGEIVEPGHANSELKVEPKQIIGPYEEQAELKARADAEDAEKKAQEDAHKAMIDELLNELYRLIDLPVPANPRAWQAPIRIGGGGGDLVITRDGIKPVLDALRRRA